MDKITQNVACNQLEFIVGLHQVRNEETEQINSKLNAQLKATVKELEKAKKIKIEYENE